MGDAFSRSDSSHQPFCFNGLIKLRTVGDKAFRLVDTSFLGQMRCNAVLKNKKIPDTEQNRRGTKGQTTRPPLPCARVLFVCCICLLRIPSPTKDPQKDPTVNPTHHHARLLLDLPPERAANGPIFFATSRQVALLSIHVHNRKLSLLPGSCHNSNNLFPDEESVVYTATAELLYLA